MTLDEKCPRCDRANCARFLVEDCGDGGVPTVADAESCQRHAVNWRARNLDAEAARDREKRRADEAAAGAAAIYIALQLLWEWGSTVAFLSDIGRRYLIMAKSVIDNPPNAGLPLLAELASLRAMAKLVIEQQGPVQMHETVAEGGEWVERPVNVWVCCGCGATGETTDAIEHATPCLYAIAHAAATKGAGE